MDNFILRLSTGLPGFLLAIVFHEAAHAWMAKRYGDTTAEQAGRLTLNPTAHIDILGTIIFPLIGAMTGGIMFGWAKPVPIDARRFKKIRHGVFWVSFAGPLINIILGTIMALLFTLVFLYVPNSFSLKSPLTLILNQAIYINFILAVFNLIPLPPLDGSKMVSSVLSYNAMRKYEEIARFSFIILLVLLFTGAISYILSPAIFVSEFLKKIFFSLFL